MLFILIAHGLDWKASCRMCLLDDIDEAAKAAVEGPVFLCVLYYQHAYVWQKLNCWNGCTLSCTVCVTSCASGLFSQ